jgi:hypothetical protein
MKRSQWTAALIALLLFCSGGVVGALAHRYYAAETVNAKTSEDFRRRDVNEMQNRLKLNTSQVGQLETIMDETKAKYKAVRDSYRPSMLKIRQDHIGRVKSILTPEQISAYDQLLAEREHHAKEQEERDREADRQRAAARQKRSSP